MKYKRTKADEDLLGKEVAARFDSGKPRYDLIPPAAFHELMLVYTYGCKKYDPDNWWKGMQWRKVIGPMMRHIFKWLRGQKYDKESGLHHLAHAAWNAIALFEYERCKLGTDDRQTHTLDLKDSDKMDEIKVTRIETYGEEGEL